VAAEEAAAVVSAGKDSNSAKVTAITATMDAAVAINADADSVAAAAGAAGAGADRDKDNNKVNAASSARHSRQLSPMARR